MSIFRALIASENGETPTPVLPTEYQEVEYIATAGSQASNYAAYINTGVNPNANTKIDIDFAMVTAYSKNWTWMPIFGSRDNTYNDKSTYFALYVYGKVNATSGTVTENYAGADPGSSSTVYVNFGQRYNIKNNGGSFYLDDVYLPAISTTNVLVQSNQPIYLFDCNNLGSPQNRQHRTKIFKCKIYNGDTLIRDFVPCYKKSNNVIGFYDLVGSTFYTNSGTGYMERGSDVNA